MIKRKGLIVICSLFSFFAVSLSTLSTYAEEPEEIKPDGLTIVNYRGGNTFSRKVSTTIDVYSKAGTIPAVEYKTIEFNGVQCNVLEVAADGENTIIQAEYTGGDPLYMNNIYDASLTKNDEYYLVGGINGGFFNNNQFSSDYGVPTGAVASNYKYVEWENGWVMTPGYGNGFSTAYFTGGDELELRYHGWENGEWKPYDDDTIEWITEGIRYNLPGQFGISGAYTLLVDGEVNHLGKEDSIYYNYNNGQSAVTLFGQKEDGTFLLVTTEGGIGDGDAETELMQQLGAVNAIRYDGGGSTQMMYADDLVNYHEVQISNMDGSVSYLKAVKDGQLLEDLEDPEREYYTFEGWYITKEGAANLTEEDKIDLKTYKFEGDTKLYAGWSRNRVTTTLMIDGQVFASEKFNQGELYSPINVPSVENGWLKEKDTFIGWFVDEEMTIPYKDTELFDGDTLTLYGKVERYVQKEYTVNINTDGNGIVTPSNTLKVKEGENLTISFDPNENFEINYVKVNGKTQELNGKNEITITNIQNDITVEVSFKQVKINALIKNSSGVELYNSQVTPGTAITIADENKSPVKTIVFDSSQVVVLDDPIKNDRPFLNWNVDVGQNNEVVIYPSYGDVYKYEVILEKQGEGTIELNNPTGSYLYGETATVTIIPADRFEISDVLVDGQSIGKVSSYTINNITQSHTIAVVFSPIQYAEGTVNIKFTDTDKYNAQDLSKYNQVINVLDDGVNVPVDVSAIIQELTNKQYNIDVNNVPESVNFTNNGQTFEVIVSHKTNVETNHGDEAVYRNINISYSGSNLPPEVINQEGTKYFNGQKVTDLVTNKIIEDYSNTYSFEAYKMPIKDGYTVSIAEIPAVDNAESYIDSFEVVYTRKEVQKYNVVIEFKDLNNVDAQDLSSYTQKFTVEAGKILDITSFIRMMEEKGYVVKDEISYKYTIEGDKNIYINLVHGSEQKEETNEYEFKRIIKYEYSDNKALNQSTTQKTILTRKTTSTKDLVTGKITTVNEDSWNPSSKLPAVNVKEVEGYVANKTFITSIELRDIDLEKDDRNYEITMTYTKKTNESTDDDKNNNQSSTNNNSSNGGTNNSNSNVTKPNDNKNNNSSNVSNSSEKNDKEEVLTTVDPDDPEVIAPIESNNPESTDETVIKNNNEQSNGLNMLFIAIPVVLGAGGLFALIKYLYNKAKTTESDAENEDEEILEEINNDANDKRDE